MKNSISPLIQRLQGLGYQVHTADDQPLNLEGWLGRWDDIQAPELEHERSLEAFNEEAPDGLPPLLYVIPHRETLRLVVPLETEANVDPHLLGHVVAALNHQIPVLKVSHDEETGMVFVELGQVGDHYQEAILDMQLSLLYDGLEMVVDSLGDIVGEDDDEDEEG